MGRSAVPVLRRLASPAGLVLAALCLGLPFVTGACTGEPPPDVPGARQQWRVTYTGLDVVAGGRPDVQWADQNSRGQLRRLDEAGVVALTGQPASPLRPQPLAWLAVALIAAGLGAAALRGPRRRAVVIATAALVSIVAIYGASLLAREQAIDDVARVLQRATPSAGEPDEELVGEYREFIHDRFQLDYGLWVTMGLLITVGLANAAGAVVASAPRGYRRGDAPD